MYQSLLLPKADVAALRAAVASSQFFLLTHFVPGLALALACPQPDFTPYLPLVGDAISEVRSNTNYPADWDELSNAEEKASKALRKFEDAVEAPPTASGPLPLRVFVLVEFKLGTNDGPRFGKTAYLNFADACMALKAKAEADFEPEVDDDLVLEEYGSAEAGSYGLDLLTKRGSVVLRHYIWGFDLAMGLTGGVTP